MNIKKHFVLTILFLAALTTMAADKLTIKTLTLVFDDTNNIKVLEIDDHLAAKLTLTYEGLGTLEGRWLIAEPGSTESKPIYRTLLLVNQPLTAFKSAAFDSPELPTARTGKYLLKFCITDSLHSARNIVPFNECPNKKLSVEGYYYVQGKAQPAIITASDNE